MADGARQMDQTFAQALASGHLLRDSSLDLPPPPALPEQPAVKAAQTQTAAPANTLIRCRSAPTT